MSDMDKMQQEAANRAKEMYSRRTPSYQSGGFPSGYNGNMKRRTPPAQRKEESFPQSKAADEEKAIENKEEQHESKTNMAESRGENFLDTLIADKERTLIILLLALLSEEGADNSLMLALMYIIM